ncbi:MAG: hypothetical protein AAGJ18_15565 [Bacteroidota bacterium]
MPRIYLFYLFLLLVSFNACRESPPDWATIMAYFPAEKVLTSGVTNKYYYHSKPKKSYDTDTDIRYINYQLNEAGALLQSNFNAGYELTNFRKLEVESQQLAIAKEDFYLQNKVVPIQTLQNTYLSLADKDSINQQIRTYQWGTASLVSVPRATRDTIILGKPAKIFAGDRFITVSYNNTTRLDTTFYEYIYAADIGLWSAQFIDKNGRNWMELVEQISQKEFEQAKNHGKHRVAYIDPNNTLDDATNFKVCDDQRIADYYNNTKGVQPIRKNGKSALQKILAKKLDKSKLQSASGYLTFRFVVNCEGQAGRFTTEQTSLDFEKTTFDPALIDHLYENVRSLDDWRLTIIRDKPRDAYTYLTFKLKDGKIIELLP